MKRAFRAVLGTMCVAVGLAAADARAAPGVCADPGRPCPGFRAHDLSFPLANDGSVRGEERSATFLAVILKSGARCSLPERERVRIQALFASRKVFSNRFECDGDVENNVKYEGAGEDAAFIAVYAGGTREEAQAFLEEVREMARFPGPNIRRMTAVFVRP